MSAAFVAKEHSIALGNSEECRMYWHIHPSAEILLVLSGEITVNVIGRAPERIEAGSCAFIFPFQSHSYERKDGTEYFRFNFIPSLLPTFFSANANNSGDRSVFKIRLAEYITFLDDVRAGAVSLYKVKGFLYNIVGDYSRSVSLTKKQLDGGVINKVISYVNEHKAEKLSLSGVALALGYNEKYLSRAINEAAGFGFSTLFSVLRMEAACDLLKTTNRTVVDIAMECGFGSERNFYRIFKDLTGYTPNEYRSVSPLKIVINDAVL